MNIEYEKKITDVILEHISDAESSGTKINKILLSEKEMDQFCILVSKAPSRQFFQPSSNFWVIDSITGLRMAYYRTILICEHKDE